MTQHPASTPFNVGDRVQVVMADGSAGATGTVERAPQEKAHFRSVAHRQHHVGVRVRWDERPFTFSPVSSVVACPHTNLRRLAEASGPVEDSVDGRQRARRSA